VRVFLAMVPAPAFEKQMEVDFSRLDLKTRNKVDEILRTDFQLKVLKAIRRQTAVAARNHLHRPRAQDGFGGKVMEVDAMIDAIWRSVYGANYTDDKDLVKFLMRRNPEIRVQSAGTKIQVGYMPGSSKSRFRKVYQPACAPQANQN